MYEAMYFLTDKDLEWMASYEQGDTVLFLSSNGIDTMTIDEITLYNDDNPWRENEGTSTFMGNSSFKYYCCPLKVEKRQNMCPQCR